MGRRMEEEEIGKMVDNLANLWLQLGKGKDVLSRVHEHWTPSCRANFKGSLHSALGQQPSGASQWGRGGLTPYENCFFKFRAQGQLQIYLNCFTALL